MAVPATGTSNPTLQYKRNFSLIVTDSNFNSLDLSQLHCKFSVKRSANQTPNSADIRVYNLKQDTINTLVQNFAPTITPQPGTGGVAVLGTQGTLNLQAGYDSNFGTIFRGNIKQIIVGRESATDTFVDFNCGDGAVAYNYALVNKVLGAGSSMAAQLGVITKPMLGLGVTLSTDANANLKDFNLPRGKVFWGASKDYMRVFAQQNGATWSIQNGQIEVIPMQTYAPGVSVVLTSKTGMIGTPQQTSFGVNVVCLLNPRIQPNQTVKIDNASVAQYKLDLGNSSDKVNLPPALNADGVYWVTVVEQQGDNRGIDWYSKLICGTVSNSTNPINSVQVSYGP